MCKNDLTNKKELSEDMISLLGDISLFLQHLTSAGNDLIRIAKKDDDSINDDKLKLVSDKYSELHAAFDDFAKPYYKICDEWLWS